MKLANSSDFRCFSILGCSPHKLHTRLKQLRDFAFSRRLVWKQKKEASQVGAIAKQPDDVLVPKMVVPP